MADERYMDVAKKQHTTRSTATAPYKLMPKETRACFGLRVTRAKKVATGCSRQEGSADELGFLYADNWIQCNESQSSDRTFIPRFQEIMLAG
jgi:hypothetical protein